MRPEFCAVLYGEGGEKECDDAVEPVYSRILIWTGIKPFLQVRNHH